MSDWTKENLGSLVTFQKGRKVETSDFKKTGFAPYLGAGSLTGEHDNYADSTFAIKANENDILMLWDGERSGLVGHKLNGVVSSTVSKLTPNTKIGSDYLYYYLLFNFDWIQGRRTGTGVPHVPKDLARILEVSYPECKGVQFKISSILSAIDRAIEKTESLITKYQKIKAGLMHDLFTRGVTADGKLRPPREQAPELYHETSVGWIPREWRVSSVGALLVEIQTGKSPSCRDVPATTGDWGVLKVSAVHPDGFRSDQNKLVESITLIEPSFEVKAGDLLMTRANTPELVGLVCLVEQPQPKLMLCDKTLRLVINELMASSGFMFFCMQQHYVRIQIESSATGTSMSMKNISQSAIRNIKLACPRLDEQRIIVASLDSARAKLRTEESKREKMKSQKLGLMHDLLTDKVPVKIDEPDKESA